jgi:hypothetical protein
MLAHPWVPARDDILTSFVSSVCAKNVRIFGEIPKRATTPSASQVSSLEPLPRCTSANPGFTTRIRAAPSGSSCTCPLAHTPVRWGTSGRRVRPFPEGRTRGQPGRRRPDGARARGSPPVRATPRSLGWWNCSQFRSFENARTSSFSVPIVVSWSFMIRSIRPVPALNETAGSWRPFYPGRAIRQSTTAGRTSRAVPPSRDGAMSASPSPIAGW